MSEPVMTVEALQAAMSTQKTAAVQPVRDIVPDPAAVQAFQGAMGTQAPTSIPFAQQISSTWQTAQNNYQGLVHRIKALTEMRMKQAPSVAELSELQYDIATLSFQQEVVTSVAKKSSDAVQTLIKNG